MISCTSPSRSFACSYAATSLILPCDLAGCSRVRLGLQRQGTYLVVELERRPSTPAGALTAFMGAMGNGWFLSPPHWKNRLFCTPRQLGVQTAQTCTAVFLAELTHTSLLTGDHQRHLPNA
jgi:hypothetical protein